MDTERLLLFYGAALLGGLAVAWRLPLPSTLSPLLIGFTAGAGQILFATELLSLAHQLRPTPLLAANAGLTVLVWMVARPWRGRPALPRPGWRGAAAFVRGNLLACGLAVAALAGAAAFGALQTRVAPVGDSYHYSMPLQWAQYGSVLPVPTSNPRTTGLAFASEALCFPAVIATKSWAPYFILAGVARAFLVCLVTAMASRLGAGKGAALCAGALALGYPALGTGTADQVLGSLWVAGALFLLAEAAAQEVGYGATFGCSVFCFLMACGVKNVVALQAPLFGLLAPWSLGARLWRGGTLRAAGLGAAAGLLCSTMLWIYVSNRCWFGEPRGPWLLRETLATDFRPQAIWTREARGVVSSFTDPAWLPGGLRERYGAAVQKAVVLLGGEAQLPDDGEYYALTGEALRPGTGFGPLGFCLLGPSLLAALALAWRRGDPEDRLPSRQALAWALFALGSLALFYLALRTQRPGLSRLLGPALVGAAPLGALLLRRPAVRILAAVVFSGVLLMELVSASGAVLRRSAGEHPGWLAEHIARLQNNHSRVLQYRWSDGASGDFTIREDWSRREYFEFLLQRVPPGSTIGLLGTSNSDEVYLFGKDFSNRVLHLRDYRAPEELRPVSPATEYLADEDGDFPDLRATDPTYRPFLTPWLEIRDEGRVVFAARKRGLESAGPR